MFEFYNIDVGQQVMDVSASTRKFQQSIIITQDPNKSGILSFLNEAEAERQSQPESQSAQTQTPSRRTGY